MNWAIVFVLALALPGLTLVVLGLLLLRRAAKREVWSGAMREPWTLATLQGFLRDKWSVHRRTSRIYAC